MLTFWTGTGHSPCPAERTEIIGEIGEMSSVGQGGQANLYYSLTRTRAHKAIITFTLSSLSKTGVLRVFLNKLIGLRWTGCLISPCPSVFSA